MSFSPTQFTPGFIMQYAGDTVPQNCGWVICNGDMYSANMYPVLAKIIWNGSEYAFGGTGDGGADIPTGSFNVPNIKGIFVKGTDDGNALKSDGNTRSALETGGAIGAKTGSYEEDFIEDHQHYVDVISLTYAFNGNQHDHVPDNNAGAISTTIDGQNENRPKNIYLNFIIKT